MLFDNLFLPEAPKNIISKCSYCQKIYAKNINGVISKTTEDDLSCEISHGICPDCLKKLES